MASPAQEAGEILNRNAVSFETDRKYNNQKAWPFWYPFIPKPYLNTDILYNGMGLLGITVRAGETLTLPIQTDRDSVYRLINVRFTAYRCILGSALDAPNTIVTAVGDKTVVGTGTTFTNLAKGQPIGWTDDGGVVRCGIIDVITDNTNLELEKPAVSVSTGVLLFKAMYSQNYGGTPNALQPANLFVFRPLTQMLKVSYIMTSLRGRYLLGGTQVVPDPQGSTGMQERPLPVTALQGDEKDGLNQIRTSALFGYDSSFGVKITNIFSEDIIVNGTLFGYKIAGGNL